MEPRLNGALFLEFIRNRRTASDDDDDVRTVLLPRGDHSLRPTAREAAMFVSRRFCARMLDNGSRRALLTLSGRDMTSFVEQTRAAAVGRPS